MTRAAAFLILISLAGSAAGQKLTADEQAAALTGVREYVRSYTASLPNYTCVQTTRQTFAGAARPGAPLPLPFRTDVIEEQISFVDGREIRTVTKINDQRPAASEQAQPGPVSQGEFGNLLYTIFDPQSGSDIRWKRAAMLDGRRVNVFEFRVPQSSGYLLVGSKGQVRARFEGSVYADRQTGAVVRIEGKCTGIPPGSEYRELNLTLDYKLAKIAGQEHLLPSGFSMLYQTTGNRAIIGAEFKSCRQFSADSTVTFDVDSVAPGAGDAEPAAVVTEIPESPKPAPPEVPAAPPSPAPAPMAEAKAPLPDQPAAAPVQDNVFRSSTQLVQVNVIAKDKDGKPITDLRRDEFQIVDNGVAQDIRIFRSEAGQPGEAAREPPAPNTFSNRTAPQAGSPGGYSVILIDSLFTDADQIEAEGTSSTARVRTLRMLRSIPAGERVAIYAQERKLRVICEFTSDRDLLERELTKWKPKPDTPGVTMRAFMTDQIQRARELQSPVRLNGDEAGEARRIDGLQRASSSDEEMELVADHLAGIPGRKKLIWLSDRFVIGPRALQKLNLAGISIYTVDVDGVCSRCSASKGMMAAAATLTGGLVYTKRNDLDVAMREAIDDGRVSFLLGFYPSGDAPVHALAVSVSRPGVTLRYRSSYQLEPPRPASASPVADLVEALNRPVDATVIPITANATRNGDSVDVSVAIDAPSLDLELSDGLWKGSAELVMRFVTAEGLPAGEASAQTLAFGFRPATWESMLKGGDPYRSHSELPVPPKATELKLLVGNLATGKIGTLTIPLSELAAPTGTSLGLPDSAHFDTEGALRQVRENVRTYLDQLPRITCTERTRQTIRISRAESTSARENSCDTHQYKMYSVQTLGLLDGKYYEPNRTRTAPDWRERMKEASLGASTGFLAALVDPQADAGLRWVRAGRVNGRSVSLYAFQAAMPEGFLLAEATGPVRVPFKGLLYTDAVTGALVWVEIQCIGIPSESEYIGAEVTVNFGSFDVAGRALNLPAHSRVRFRMKQGDTTNEAVYSAYRIAEFGADSDIKFGDEVDAPGASTTDKQ